MAITMLYRLDIICIMDEKLGSDIGKLWKGSGGFGKFWKVDRLIGYCNFGLCHM